MNESSNWGKLVDRLRGQPFVSRRRFWRLVEPSLLQCLSKKGNNPGRTAAAQQVRDAFRAFAAINYRDGGRLGYVIQAYDSLRPLVRGDRAAEGIFGAPLSVIPEDELPKVEQWVERLEQSRNKPLAAEMASPPAPDKNG